MIRVYNNPKYAGERVMLLFTNPTDVERLVEGGVKITSVNVGGMAFRQGKTQVNNAVSVDEKDIEAFKKLNARGIELEVRKVSTDPKLKMYPGWYRSWGYENRYYYRWYAGNDRAGLDEHRCCSCA